MSMRHYGATVISGLFMSAVKGRDAMLTPAP
jgi:hypothetical protein